MSDPTKLRHMAAKRFAAFLQVFSLGIVLRRRRCDGKGQASGWAGSAKAKAIVDPRAVGLHRYLARVPKVLNKAALPDADAHVLSWVLVAGWVTVEASRFECFDLASELFPSYYDKSGSAL